MYCSVTAIARRRRHTPVLPFFFAPHCAWFFFFSRQTVVGVYCLVYERYFLGRFCFVGSGPGGFFWLRFCEGVIPATIDSIDRVDRIDSHRQCVFTRTPKTERPCRYGFVGRRLPRIARRLHILTAGRQAGRKEGRQAGGRGREGSRAGRGHTFSCGIPTAPVL